MLDMSLEDDQIEPEEHEIISNVLEANDFCAKDIMVPRANVIGIQKNCKYDEIVETFKREGYSRLVVLDDRNEKVHGILYLKDMMFLSKEEFDMDKLLREPYFTFETKKTQDLLTDLRRTANSMAVVLDEYGGLSGILTVEDIVEEYIGQIRDEYDEDELKQIKKIDDKTYEIYGSVNITDVNEATGLELESENYNSLGGYIIEKLQEFPKNGDELTIQDTTFEVVQVVDNKIEKVRVMVLSDESTETDNS
jgi:CBS domain containing-hemolysin-like protein